MAGLASAEPIWGCEAEALPAGSVHVWVSTFNAEAEQLLPWMWHLGLTGADIFAYYRHSDASIADRFAGVQLPCSMALHVVQLSPNKGREAAVYLHHMVKYYASLPEALFMVHDHGPASRHSLCGPFYRRMRGFYRGLAQRATQPKGALAKFAGMAVTLSSGCVETWARGCCALYVCSGTRDACPFLPGNCTRYEDGSRQFYMHAGNGLYDSRFENQLVGEAGATYPMALLRYAGNVHSSSRMWNISFEYPPDQVRRPKEATLAALKDILARHDFARKKRASFKSCCGSMIVRKGQVRRWPVGLYEEMLNYSMDPTMDYEATKAVSGPGWQLWADREYSQEDLLLYMRVDVRLKEIQGCPARTAEVQAVLKGLRGAGAATGGSSSGGGGGGRGNDGGDGSGAAARALQASGLMYGSGMAGELVGQGDEVVPMHDDGPWATMAGGSDLRHAVAGHARRHP
jgi:hypothetical protein